MRGVTTFRGHPGFGVNPGVPGCGDTPGKQDQPRARRVGRLGIACKTHPTAECRNGASRGCLFGPAARHEPVQIIGSPARQKGPSHWFITKRSAPLSVPIPVKGESASKNLSLCHNIMQRHCAVSTSTIGQDRASRPRGGILVTIELLFRFTRHAKRLRRVLRESWQLHEYQQQDADNDDDPKGKR